MNVDTIPDPAAAVRRVQAELDRPRWHSGLIPAREAHEALSAALYGEHRTDPDEGVAGSVGTAGRGYRVPAPLTPTTAGAPAEETAR